jgi:NAD(P)-dependent dehydrogenase (short-subunit alcohol dehydrogenase family)
MKNYVVIGGSSGIGKEIVNSLKTEDATIYATYNSHEMADETNVHYQQLNVLTDTFDDSELPEEIHGLVYCPGSINLKPFHRFKGQDFVDDLQLQVVGATTIIQQLLPKMKNSKDASIVMFSTIAVQNGYNFHAQVAVSKGAIEGLTRALAAEFAPGIRVNAVAPSLTDTPLAERLLSTEEKKAVQAEKIPLKRVGSAKDIAAAATYLLSNQSSWVTGQILHVDGGSSSIK